MTAFPPQFRCRSHIVFALIVAVILVSLHNWRFWKETLEVVQPASVGDVWFLVSLFLLLVFGHACVVLLLPGWHWPQIAAAILFVLAATAGYFRDEFGAVIDKDMIRNIVRTDLRETSDFLTPRLMLYIFVLGLVPAFITARVQLPDFSVGRQFIQRGRFFGAGLIVVLLCALPAFSHYASFLREHKSIRNLLNPAQPIYATFDYLLSTDFIKSGPVTDLAGTPHRVPASQGQKPLLLFLVIGETARAQNFQVGGYARASTPELSRLPGVLYFNDAHSCGTSTAVSLPCMLSHLGHDRFDVRKAARQTNLLDAMRSAGFRVEWRENNTGTHGVALRVQVIEYSKGWPRYVSAAGGGIAEGPRHDGLCKAGTCFDEIMLSGLAEELKTISQDTAIVFHQIGSHGPAYWQRYPDRFADFKPVCQTTELGRCTREEIVNAYDNSIRYTDHNLAEQIRLLADLSGQADSLLIYASDHGESLGEKGLYLHGAPYFMAPDEQTRIPILLWMSDGYRTRFSIDDACLQAKRSLPVSHDNIYHTVIGGLGVRNDLYDQRRDIMARCRTGEPLR